ncbi:ATP-binding cassette domain-containing protein [Herbiconiux moechotypicola]|uniref:ATP-binding cassette domain-containing protein n=1 Tax=Herbiconiux moechotypicola TaxID=637393 RepID=A0ABP5QKU2_9MICO|nr:ATP-binding cassette domain-containing protein [Herbiconiux moechotypicola]MCS5731403.1 ATP-binding cassette domain-containing protein [Herbiconiux moechotypicola]
MSFVPSVVLHDVSYTWPDGIPALTHVSAAFGRGRTGLVGLNGVGKSTLLRLIAGELTPTGGTITTTGVVDHLPQDLTRRRASTVADLLGVGGVVDAIRAVERGEVDQELFDRIGDDWDVEERSLAALGAAGLDLEGRGLDHRASALSGGEAMLAALVGVRVRRADVALLDEPTNNLDADGRERVHEMVRTWRGALIVVSHDTTLLELMDDTAELREGGLSIVGGPYSAYRARVEAEQAAALGALRAAEQSLKTEKRQRVQAEERIAHSERQGRKDAANRKYIGAVVDDRRNSAEKAQGSRRALMDDKVAAARRAVEAAETRVRDDDHITIRLPDPGVPAGRRIARIVGTDGREFVMQGPERVALTGPNGAGKTTLLRQLLGDGPRASGLGIARADVAVDRIGYLSQRLDSLDDDASVLANVQRVAPRVPAGELRNQLARLLVRGSMVDRPVRSISGGERFRAALAQLLLADPPAQLLLLDEPTNDLDLPSVTQLVDSLANYRGALLVVSHDRSFLDRLALTTELHLGRDGALTPVHSG